MDSLWRFHRESERQTYLRKPSEVHRNRAHVQAGENAWGFGQVVSILLLLPIFIEMVTALWEWRSRVKRNRGNEVGHASEAMKLEAVGQEVGKTVVVEKDIT